MKRVGIFEAKTHFSRICDQVSQGRGPVLIEKRGKPLVMITMVSEQMAARRSDILTDWDAWNGAHPDEAESDFPNVWKERIDKETDPIRDVE